MHTDGNVKNSSCFIVCTTIAQARKHSTPENTSTPLPEIKPGYILTTMLPHSISWHRKYAAVHIGNQAHS